MNKQRFLFVPGNLDLDRLRKQFPPDFDFNQEYCLWICFQLYEVASYRDKYRDNFRFVPLSAKILQRKVHSYKQYLSWLITAGVLETDGKCIPKEKCYGYRFTTEYQGSVEPVEIKSWRLLRKPKDERKREIESEKQYPHLRKWFDGLRINWEAAISFLQERFKRESDQGVINAWLRFDTACTWVLKIQLGIITFTVDKTGNRLHTNLTFLPKCLRDFLTYREEGLVALDVCNSQPLLTCVLYQAGFLSAEPVGNHINLNLIHPEYYTSYTSLPIMLEKEREEHDSQQIMKYEQSCTDGVFYEVLTSTTAEITGIKHERDTMKERTFTVMFSSPKSNKPETKKAREIFNSVYPFHLKALDIYKWFDHSDPSIILQRIESEIILNRITKRINQEHPALPIYTIHDSIITPKGEEGKVIRIMEEEFQKAIDLIPKIKKENWSPSKIIEYES